MLLKADPHLAPRIKKEVEVYLFSLSMTAWPL
jgi:hypothetical protein